MLRWEPVTPWRRGHLPGRNARTDDLEDLFKERTASPGLTGGLFVHHGALVEATVILFFWYWLSGAWHGRAITSSWTNCALDGWWEASAVSCASGVAPKEALYSPGEPRVLYVNVWPS